MKRNHSRSYWKRRESAARKERAKREAAYQAKIEEMYEGMLDDIQKEIDSFYAKYAGEEGITIAEAKKRASRLDIEEYARKAKRYVESKDFSKEANDDMRLYNMTMKVNRLELLKSKIALELTGNFDKIRDYYDEIIMDESMKEFERLAGILGETITNADALKRAKTIAGASFHNATFSERIWGQRDLLKLEIEKNLRAALIQGKSSRELARRLVRVFGVSRYNAERLMTTELRRAQTEVAKQSYERNGNRKYEYMATGPHPCENCKKLDGKIFYVSDMMPGENASPMHPQCHCTTAPYNDREEYEKWLDYLDKGGTTEEWEQLKTKGNVSSGKTGKKRMNMKLQFFAQNDKRSVEQKIKQGAIDEKQFRECRDYFRSIFKNGVKTPITTVYDKKDRFYHIANRHDYMISKENIQRIKKTLENPDSIYETKDKFSNAAICYIEKNQENPLLVIERNGIITSYEPDKRYLENNVKGKGKLIWKK